MIYGVDAVHGHNNVSGATLFPHNIGIGATRDPALVAAGGRDRRPTETKATGVPWAFAPCVCVSRDERWGRTYESLRRGPGARDRADGTSSTGLQDNGVLATAKHFAGDGGTTYGSSTTGNYKIDQGVTPSRPQLGDAAPAAVRRGGQAARRRLGHAVVLEPAVSRAGRAPLKMHANQDLITGWLKSSTASTAS